MSFATSLRPIAFLDQVKAQQRYPAARFLQIGRLDPSIEIDIESHFSARCCFPEGTEALQERLFRRESAPPSYGPR
jgi:hypothetical protein